MTAPAFLDVLEEIIETVVEPSATEVDRTGSFPRPAVTALGEQGLLGLLSSTDVGGMGLGLADAAQVVRRLAASCSSTAMVVCMHYSATAVIEQFGSIDVRRSIADGSHLSTLASSETGSRSQFWAPLGSATADGDDVVLDASKSWVTSAGEADSYGWTSRPMGHPTGPRFGSCRATGSGHSRSGTPNSASEGPRDRPRDAAPPANLLSPTPQIEDMARPEHRGSSPRRVEPLCRGSGLEARGRLAGGPLQGEDLVLTGDAFEREQAWFAKVKGAEALSQIDDH